MYNILIAEDEHFAAVRLKKMLAESGIAHTLVAQCDSVEGTVNAIAQNGEPDLMLLDIQLADGLSFSIFEKMYITCPVIFTTAYDEYAIRAFKVNSIDYLLKPIEQSELDVALEKFMNLHSKHRHIDNRLIATIKASLTQPQFKTRYSIKIGDRIRTVPIEDILYFYSFEKATYLCSVSGKHYCLDQTLDAIEKQTDANLFFRVNRTFLVKYESITDIVAFSNSRLKLTIEHYSDKDVIVSREKVGAFKEWIG